MPLSPPAYAVIVAGGSGSRMGMNIPKQFLDLCGMPVLYYSIRAFLDALSGVRIILVLPELQISKGEDVLAAFPEGKEIRIVAGGRTRYESVAAGLKLATPPSIVLVHDGARPLVTPELIRRCYEGARNNGSAVPVMPMHDSIRQVSGSGSRAIAREDLRIVQTPQAFNTSFLQDAFLQPYLPVFTDEASVVEWTGKTVHLVEGSSSNLKITTPEDLIIAEALLRQRMHP